MVLSRLVLRMLPLFLAMSVANLVFAQDYPSKTIRIITGSAGGGSDFNARTVAQGISGPLGQPVIVENRVSLSLGEVGSKAPPDGYLLTVQGGSLWVVTLLQKMPYDVVRDFAPISLISRDVNIVAVHPSLPVKSAKELIALAKARPGTLNYGSGNPGSPSHLAGELFKSMAGAKIVHVAYKGVAPAVTALITGEVQVIILDSALIEPHAKSERLKALAVTSAEPSALTPGLPTVSATGLPGYEMVGLAGIWAPAKTPAAIINRLNQEIVRYITQPAVKERFLNAGAEVVASSPDQFAAFIKADVAKMGKVIKEAGIKMN